MAAPEIRFPLLAIDTASANNWVGLKLGPNDLLAARSNDDPSRSLFRLVTEVTEAAGAPLGKIATIVYCEGPGSMLGARTAVMAIRAWEGIGIPAARNLYTYSSLAMGSLLAPKAGTGSSDRGTIVTDARRNSWNQLDLNDPSRSISIIENAALERGSGPIYTLTGFPSWTKTQAVLLPIEYDLDALFAGAEFAQAVRPTRFAAPIAVRESEYAKWTPRYHSAPTPTEA